MGQQRHVEGFNGPVLPAPRLLLRPAGCTPVPRGTDPAPLEAPGKNPHLPLRDLVPERCLQMRAGSLALPDAQPEAAPASQQVPGTSWAVLKQKGFLQNHLQAGQKRDAGAFPNPSGSPPRGFVALTRGQQPSREVASLYTGSEEGERRRCNVSAEKNKGGVDTCALSLQRARWKPAQASPPTLTSPWLELPAQPVSSLCFLLRCRFSSVAPK